MVKKMSFVALLSLLLCLSGCNSERSRVSMETNALTVRFQKLMEAGKTTREQEQAYIKRVSDVTLQLDRSIRGTDKANQTRQAAVIYAETGVDPKATLDLNK